MTKDDKKAVKETVEKVAEIERNRKEMAGEIKDLVEACKEKTGVGVKVLRQLAKEMDWDRVQRQAQQLHEQELDECRHALGILADTPLGEAAQASMH